VQIANIFSSSYIATQQGAPPARAATSSAVASPDDTTNSGGVSRYDFTNMTPQQLQSTVNDLVKSGKLSLKDSSPLLTIAGFGGTGGTAANGMGQPMDVLSMLKAGISYKEQAQAGEPNSGIQYWQNALAALQNLQGTPSGVDTYA
jgi:hypothetical protein